MLVDELMDSAERPVGYQEAAIVLQLAPRPWQTALPIFD
jgi:hypothetical protein